MVLNLCYISVTKVWDLSQSKGRIVTYMENIKRLSHRMDENEKKKKKKMTEEKEMKRVCVRISFAHRSLWQL